MKIIYTPDGGSRRTWDLDPNNPPWDVTYGTEKATGWPWEEFTDKLSKASVIALQALIWTLRKRDEPRLGIDSVQPSWGQVDVEDDEVPNYPEPDPEGEPDPEA